VSEASVETTVRFGPAAANLARSIWRQRELLALGLILGLVLGYWALPKVLSSGSTYDATIRMQVQQPPADAIQPLPPGVGEALGEDGGGASPDLLKDIAVADNVVRQLKVQDELTGTLLLDRLTFTPLAGSSYVDLSFSHGNPRLAAEVVNRYANQFAAARNKTEGDRLRRVIAELEAYARKLGTAPTPNGAPGPGQAILDQVNVANVRLAIIGQPTSVIGQPIVATNGPPLSRKVTLALGLLLGLAIGAGAGLLVETAFRKVVTPSDAEEAADLPFIAEVRKAGIRRTALPVIDRPFSPAAEDYRRVGTALERQGLGRDIQVLAVVSADPKEGKSLLAANLAHSLARQGRGVVLVSSDLRQPKVEKLLGLRPPRAGLAEALQDETINPLGLLVSINDHLLVLPAGMPGKHPGELLASKRLAETIDVLRRVGIVILDTPPARLSADAMALSGVADATVLVNRSGVSRIRSVHEATSGLRRDGLRQLGVVLVGTSSSPFLSLRHSYREPPEVGTDEPEPLVQPRQLGPRPTPPGPAPERAKQRASDVTDLTGAAAERNRRAVE
jgi:capsular exopolysaccharide synthesis family protein